MEAIAAPLSLALSRLSDAGREVLAADYHIRSKSGRPTDDDWQLDWVRVREIIKSWEAAATVAAEAANEANEQFPHDMMDPSGTAARDRWISRLLTTLKTLGDSGPGEFLGLLNRVVRDPDAWRDELAKLETFGSDLACTKLPPASLAPEISHVTEDVSSVATDEGVGELAQALGILATNAGLSNKEIASRVGVHVKTLNKPSWKPFQEARKAIKETMKAALPRGSKAKDGTLESVDDDDDDE